jgi:hypothetical protein
MKDQRGEDAGDETEEQQLPQRYWWQGLDRSHAA